MFLFVISRLCYSVFSLGSFSCSYVWASFLHSIGFSSLLVSRLFLYLSSSSSLSPYGSCSYASTLQYVFKIAACCKITEIAVKGRWSPRLLLPGRIASSRIFDERGPTTACRHCALAFVKMLFVARFTSSLRRTVDPTLDIEVERPHCRIGHNI